ncbi:N-acetyltransferase [Pediococcus inopinatus]|uniref:N-acetyltransferase n=1 Tax=Pediococcus inopinatus TaxID=114090 RepID=UPI002A6B015F|nr:N-acetyltransferase [Pediococcus inopinatus]WPP08375.1 N-acetyltransferase [Pediococcus inopinatus]
MLVKYRDSFQKIVMGLLSFIPGLKDIDRINQELDWYAASNDRNLYLQKNEAGDFIGLVGVEKQDQYLMVHHLAFIPQQQTQANEQEIFDSLAKNFPDLQMMGTLETTPALARWEKGKPDQHGE